MKLYLALIMLSCSVLTSVERINAAPDPFENILYGNNDDNKIILGYVDLGANGGGGNDRLIGNRRDNILNGGSGNDTIMAHDGDDIITLGKGRDYVDGGDGIDTVIYEDKLYSDTNIRKLSQRKIVNIDYEDTLVNIEFIQFADVTIDAVTLEIAPVN